MSGRRVCRHRGSPTEGWLWGRKEPLSVPPPPVLGMLRTEWAGGGSLYTPSTLSVWLQWVMWKPEEWDIRRGEERVKKALQLQALGGLNPVPRSLLGSQPDCRGSHIPTLIIMKTQGSGVTPAPSPRPPRLLHSQLLRQGLISPQPRGARALLSCHLAGGDPAAQMAHCAQHWPGHTARPTQPSRRRRDHHQVSCGFLFPCTNAGTAWT